MRNATLRLLALLLTMVMTLSLTACDLDIRNLDFPDWNLDFFDWDHQKSSPQTSEPAETEREQREPIVRLYLPVLILVDGDEYGRYVYSYPEEGEDSFSAKVYRINEDGTEVLIREDTYYDQTSIQREYKDNGHAKETIRKFNQHGQELSIQTTSTEALRTGNDTEFCYMSSTYIDYDDQGRMISQKTIWVWENGEPEEEISESQIEETETGYIRWVELFKDCYILYEYSNDNLLINYKQIWHDAEINILENYYNEAGMLNKQVYSTRTASYSSQSGYEFGEWSSEEYITHYETIEVPLSVARRFCMFKWEYID